jgi:hypothetical protein
MRSPVALLVFALAALVIAVPAAAAKTFNGTYKADITSAKYTDNNTPGDSVGDQLAFKVTVKENKKKRPKKLSRSIGTCDRIEGKAWACKADITWFGGHVLTEWSMVDGQRILHLKVTAGTKLLAGATGEITLTRLIKDNPMYWRASVRIVL